MTHYQYQLSQEQKNFYDGEGYLVVKGALSASEVLALKSECCKVWSEQVKTGAIVQDPSNPLDSLFARLNYPHQKNPNIIPYMIHPTIMDILEQISGEEMYAITSYYYFKTAGKAGIPNHQDNFLISADPGTCYSVWISIDHTSRENGGLYVIPRTQQFAIQYPTGETSGLYPVLEVPEGYQIVDLTTEPGDAVIFNGNLYHGSYDNISENDWRQVFLTHYVPESVERMSMFNRDLVSRTGERKRRRYYMNDKLPYEKYGTLSKLSEPNR
ncbi:phytanoyl-CoA dioxygenase family protein [Brevibacillus fulvus]|uniref:Ectoine hydroxylase-related dioxygenase (Phytanoyl-CoA dioxygenase family) n=1 Tax=Brevibacillus fulvus TaxID=1125967 RepID=A0A939BRI7_9BACL|nr:phytanoyl-CoA dioxygenase family protein [Brevibacillus fulvus]MBM7589667.1 ectoine hydroxylase-related dioxygenase (phytanoyl-CoA dioxygenase family) [Brevibacillus fulvus]